jgi:hypothetical protein
MLSTDATTTHTPKTLWEHLLVRPRHTEARGRNGHVTDQSASIMLNTLASHGWCVLPVVAHMCAQCVTGAQIVNRICSVCHAAEAVPQARPAAAAVDAIPGCSVCHAAEAVPEAWQRQLWLWHHPWLQATDQPLKQTRLQAFRPTDRPPATEQP